MTVTVCIPCRDDEGLMRDALDSIWEQTTLPLEVIVVDDGSTDLIQPSIPMGPGPQLRFVRVTQRGIPNALNTGLMLARGDWFVPLESDDTLAPSFIAECMAASKDDVSAVIPTMNVSTAVGAFDVHRPLPVTLDELWESNTIPYCAMYRTHRLREIGGWHGAMVTGAHDWDLWVDLVSRDAILAYAPGAVFTRTIRPGSFTTRVMDHHRDEIAAEMRRHHTRLWR